MKIKLILENGAEFIGDGIGYIESNNAILGEVVFNTGMTGYQEVFTDPSYCDQIVTMTYPMIGNYGISECDNENIKPALKGIVIGEHCQAPSNYTSTSTLNEFLLRHQIPGLTGIDTRALTKILRNFGTMKGILVMASSNYKPDWNKLVLDTNQIEKVSQKSPTNIPGQNGPRIVLIDFGYKKGIAASLIKRGCDLVVVPYNTSAHDISTFKPDGILLSNGPGDPETMRTILPTIQELQQKYPLLGICMGHQVLALANGASTHKLKYGHRGCNHPVYDLESDRVFLTSQNHGYGVDEKSVASTPLKIFQINLNDKSIEGLKHKTLPVFSVQYHPEASPGPEDTAFIFDQFLSMVKQGIHYAKK